MPFEFPSCADPEFFFPVVPKDIIWVCRGLVGVRGIFPGGTPPPSPNLDLRIFLVTPHFHVFEDWVFLLYMCREKQNQFICHEFIF